MADKKISQLTAASTPLAGSEELPIVQSGETRRVTSDNLTVKNVRSNATTGVLQVVGPTAGTTRTMTTPDANFTVARTDAAQNFVGNNTFDTDTLVIDSANNRIGSGLTSPNYQLDLLSSLTGTTAGSNVIVSVSSNASGRDAHIRLNDSVNASARVGYLNGALYLWTNAAVRLTSEVSGNITVNTGNLVIGTSGKGIDFSATANSSGTMTSELLADYEEGTFTPTWTTATGSGATVDLASGWYTKIGNRLYFDIAISTNGHGTAAGAITIGGFPFTQTANANQLGSACCALQANGGMAGAYTPALRVNYNAATAVPVIFSATTGSATMTAADWGVSGSYRFTGSYQVA